MEPCRLPRGLWTGPFVESVGRYDASALLERVAKCTPRVDRFRARINSFPRHARVFRPALDEAPGCGNHFAIFVFYPDDEVRLRRRDVVARLIVDERVGGHAEFGRQRIAVAARDCEASAHLRKSGNIARNELPVLRFVKYFSVA